MRLIFVVSLLAFAACGIKGNPRPPKVTFVADDAPDAGCCKEASQGKQSPSAAEKPTSNTETVK